MHGPFRIRADAGMAVDATISKLKKRDRPGLAAVSAKEVDDDD
jgi:hypothetical protein